MREGWQIKTLGELCNIARGGSPRPIQKYLTDKPDGVNWIKIGDATASSKYIYKTKEKIKPDGIKRSRLVKPGDFLLSNSMSFGRPYIVRTTGCIHDGWLVLSDKSGSFDQDYLYYFLGSAAAYKQFDSLAAGSTVRNLNTELVKRVTVPLPPISEQQRVVAVLDEVFAALSTAILNAERNLKNARELFDSYVHATFANRDGGWDKTNLGSEVDLLVGFAFKSPQYTKGADGIKLLRGDNVVQNALRWDDVKRWPSTDADSYANYNLKIGDLVLAMDRTWITAGLKYAVIEKPDLPCLLVQRVARLRCRSGLANRFLAHLIGSPQFTNYILGIQTGLSVPHISGKQINDFVFWKPSVAEQTEIGADLDNLAFNVCLLEDTYKEKLSTLANLKQSILQIAFSGGLTASPSKVVEEAAA